MYKETILVFAHPSIQEGNILVGQFLKATCASMAGTATGSDLVLLKSACIQEDLAPTLMSHKAYDFFFPSLCMVAEWQIFSDAATLLIEEHIILQTARKLQ